VQGRLDQAYSTLDEVIEHGDADLSAHAFFFKLFARGHGESISSAELERQARERLAVVEQTASGVTLAQGYLTLCWALHWGGRRGGGGGWAGGWGGPAARGSTPAAPASGRSSWSRSGSSGRRRSTARLRGTMFGCSRTRSRPPARSPGSSGPGSR